MYDGEMGRCISGIDDTPGPGPSLCADSMDEGAGAGAGGEGGSTRCNGLEDLCLSLVVVPVVVLLLPSC